MESTTKLRLTGELNNLPRRHVSPILLHVSAALLSLRCMSNLIYLQVQRFISRFNDQGAAHYKTKDFGMAFDAFTEAIRLCPQKAVYHCNRAATALKLSKFDVARIDAENAIKKDPGCLKPILRAATACLGLKQPSTAAKYFKQVLGIDPLNKVFFSHALKLDGLARHFPCLSLWFTDDSCTLLGVDALSRY